MVQNNCRLNSLYRHSLSVDFPCHA